MSTPRLTPAQKHAAELDAMRTRYETRLTEMVHEHKDNARAHRRGAFWQGAFLIGAPSIVIGIVLGAVITYFASVSTLPVALKNVQDMAMMRLYSERPQ